MPEYRININERFSSAFGFVAKNVTPRVLDIGLSNGGLYLPIPTYNKAAIRAFSQTGAPVFDLLEMDHPNLPQSQTSEGLRSVFQFDMPVMIDSSRRKRLSTTQVNENQEAGIAPGEVVESFGFEPWSIRIRGLLVDMENHNYPFDQVEALNALVGIHDILKCNSEYLNALDVTNCYITEVGLPSEPNYPDSQPFILMIKSYEPVTALKLN